MRGCGLGWMGRRGRWLFIALVLHSAPVHALRLDLNGERLDLGIHLSVRQVIEENKATQREPTQVKVRLLPRWEWRREFRVVGSAVALAGGPTSLARKDGVFQWRQVFQNRSPALDLEELYVDARWRNLDLRLGKQRVAWGKLDRFSPVDVVNALTYTDPFLVEESERRIGTPAVLSTYTAPPMRGVPELRISALWVPVFLPYRFPDARCELQGDAAPRCEAERWFPPAAVPPPVFVIPTAAIGPGSNGVPYATVPLSFRVRNVTPRATLRDGSFGARLSARVAEVDAAAYYFHGYDPLPAFLFEAWASGTPDNTATNPLRVRDLVGYTFLRPVFRTIDLWGIDSAYTWGPFALRGEAAFVSGRPFARDVRTLLDDPNVAGRTLRPALMNLANGAGFTPVPLPQSFVVRSAFEWGSGLDYLVRGWLFLLQVNQTRVLNNETRLLIRDVETRLFFTARKNVLAERLQLNLLAGHGIESDYSFARPRLTYKWNDWLSTECGYLFIAGRRQSLIGQYRSNDQGWVSFSVRF